MELLAEHLSCWGCHIAFPELSFLTLAQLRKFAKATPVDRFRQGGSSLQWGKGRAAWHGSSSGHEMQWHRGWTGTAPLIAWQPSNHPDLPCRASGLSLLLQEGCPPAD